jgi:hypothetical protein
MLLDLLMLLWGGYALVGHAHDINCANPPNEVIALGHNITPALTSADGINPAWSFTLESRYHPGCGPNWLQEAHIQWRSADGATGLRPFSVSVNPVAESGAVGVFGRFVVHDDAGNAKWQHSNGTVWAGVTHIRTEPDKPIMSGWTSSGEVEVARVKDDRTLVLGRNATAVRIGSGPAPVVASCDDLITYFADKGVIVDGR